MTFEEWWGGDRDRTLAYDLMKVLTEAAAQAWRAAEAATREELLTQFNRTGVDIDAALHGRVNEESPIANRLKMIAAIAQPQWRPMESAPKDGTPFLAHWNAEELPVVASFRDGYFRGLDGDSDPMMLLGWMPLPPELGQEARDVT